MKLILWKLFTDLSGSLGLGAGVVHSGSSGGSTAGQPIGLLLLLTKVS